MTPKEKEFNLSDERTPIIANFEDKSKVIGYNYWEEDIKEFIRLLKERFGDNQVSCWFVKETIDKLAGDKIK